jgi:hypothetical protein
MPTCPDSPSRPPREELDRLIDLVAWAKTCLLIAAATPPGSPQRDREVAKLKKAVVDPRRVTNEILGRLQELPDAIRVELRVCELAIPKLEAGAILRQSPPHGDAGHTSQPSKTPTPKSGS